MPRKKKEIYKQVVLPLPEMPSLEKIKSYTAELGLTDKDAEEIHDHWLSNGFKLKGGNEIQDWQAVIRTWQRREWFLSQQKAKQNLNAMEAKQEQLRKAAIQRMKEKKDES